MAITKVALVTASSAGLGAAIAKALAPNFRVVINYFSRPEKAAQVLKDCEEAATASASTSSSSSSSSDASPSPRFHSIQADVTQRPDINRLIQETVTTMGRLDVVVSNAGWTRITDLYNLDEQLNEDDWDRCFNVNVKSHLWVFAAARPHLESNAQGGSFTTIASLAGVHRPSGSSLPYAVSKAAEIHMVKGLAMICGPKIRCNTVSPGLLMTEWGEKFEKEMVDALVEKSLLKRLATVEDVAAVVRGLVESGSVTGQNLVVDAGVGIV